MPSFIYTPGIPVGDQTPAAQRPALQTNTTSVSDWTNVDHYGFNLANGGYHQKSTYVDQVSDPAAIAGADIFYGKTVNALIELFMRRPTESAIQLTSGSVVNTAALSAAGQTFLPGGVKLKWGVVTVAAGGSTTVTFTVVGLTAFQAAGIAGFATAFSNGSQFNISNVTTTGITVSSPGGGSAFWLAIGV